jgi:D-psicose/D-tagatose/L-ribulose 3-epimerase
VFKLGVDSFIWAEVFEEKDLWILAKAKKLGFEVLDLAIAYPDRFPLEAVKREKEKVGIEVVTSTTLSMDGNIISPDPEIRKNGVRILKKLIDINNTLDSKIFGGLNYAAWGYLTKKPRTQTEWDWSVSAMTEVAKYAKETGECNICVEVVNRFETHFLNIASDAVQYCKDIGTGNVKVHLDCFHMNIEEFSFVDAIKTCGKEYLGYFHTCENNRGIPGTGHIPWRDIFVACKEIGFYGPFVIESFDPNFKELAGTCALWRWYAPTGEALAIEGLANLKKIVATV